MVDDGAGSIPNMPNLSHVFEETHIPRPSSGAEVVLPSNRSCSGLRHVRRRHTWPWRHKRPVAGGRCSLALGKLRRKCHDVPPTSREFNGEKHGKTYGGFLK